MKVGQPGLITNTSMFKKRAGTVLTDTYHQIKEDVFSFGKIERYFLLSKKDDVFQTISDRTYEDLDLEDVFKFIDRTASKVGQQYLYNLLRTIPLNDSRSERLEYLIKIFNEDPDLKKAVLHEISGLNDDNSYYIASLFLEKYIPKPKWFLIIQILSGISICSVLLAFIFPQLFIFLIFLLPVNFGFHYWNKNNLYRYGNSIPKLLRLNQIAKKILKSKNLGKSDGDLNTSVKVLDSLGFFMSVFKFEAKLQSEIGQLVDYIFEIIKALFLIEPILLFGTLQILDTKRHHIKEVFDFTGEIDAAISISSLRESLPYYCIPNFTLNKKQLDIKDSYHPLIYNAVSNSITLHEKSALLTGSNMSGKTTFIRTIGINAILAQNIHTCFAREFVLSKMKVHSAIRISDDLLSEKSYYFEEVLAIKNLLTESKSGSENLFLLDELFKGTNTIERIAAGKSILSYLTQENNIVLVSTHDPELAEFLHETYNLYHFTEVIQDNDILFDYKIKPGKLTTTNAIRILELNNYPREVIDEAIRLSRQIKK